MGLVKVWVVGRGRGVVVFVRMKLVGLMKFLIKFFFEEVLECFEKMIGLIFLKLLILKDFVFCFLMGVLEVEVVI